MNIQLYLIVTAYIANFVLIFVQPHNQMVYQAVRNEMTNERENPKNYQHLFNLGVEKNTGKNGIYYKFLMNKVAREQQDFDTIKEELWNTQVRNTFKKRNFYQRIGDSESIVPVKREVAETVSVTENLGNQEKPQNTSASPYARRKLPLGVTDIRQILEQDYAYVDKTGFVLDLIRRNRSAQITRPKGFGKTLFLSTLEEIFKGDKELFRGTDIYRSDYSWTKYIVYRVDLSQFPFQPAEAFHNGLKQHVAQFIESFGVTANSSENLSEILCLLKNVSLVTGVKVVVLVDEYDSPITNLIQYPRRLNALNMAEDNRQVIAFFLKFVTRSYENPGVRFAFVVGVHTYEWVGGAPVHILNTDMDVEYATIMGFTEDEVRNCFRNHIRDIARRRSRRVNVTEEEIVDEMRLWYGGYRFSGKEVTVYNPESTLRYLSARKADNYWYVSRNRSVLIDEAARDNMPLGLQQTTVGMRLKPDDFNISYLRWIDVRALMYRSGYLTIRKFHPHRMWYDLDFPNKEAQDAYNITYLRRDRSKDHHKVITDDWEW